MISPRTDIDACTQQFAASGRVQLPGFLLPEAAQSLLEASRRCPGWGLVTRVGGQHRTFDAAAMEQLDVVKRSSFEALVSEDARAGFQYLYERFPLYDRGRASQLVDDVLVATFQMLRSSTFLELLREITSAPEIAFADGQLTRYRRGHYLTLHNDHADGLQRIAAFVLNLTPRWGADHGGQLQFADRDGNVIETVTPRFNTLTLFRVPTPHLVSAVAPFVTDTRNALTGWLRSGPEDELSMPAAALKMAGKEQSARPPA